MIPQPRNLSPSVDPGRASRLGGETSRPSPAVIDRSRPPLLERRPLIMAETWQPFWTSGPSNRAAAVSMTDVSAIPTRLMVAGERSPGGQDHGQHDQRPSRCPLGLDLSRGRLNKPARHVLSTVASLLVLTGAPQSVWMVCFFIQLSVAQGTRFPLRPVTLRHSRAPI